MKKIVGLLSLFALVMIMSCSNRKAEVTKEVIVVPAASAPVVKKPTVIVLDKNGVKVESKKVDVTVKKE